MNGSETVFITRTALDTAYHTMGVALDFYKSWNSTWNNISKFFSAVGSIPTMRLKQCNDTRAYWPDSKQRYVNLTGDLDGWM